VRQARSQYSCLLYANLLLDLFSNPEDGSNKLLENVTEHLLNYTGPCTTSQYSSNRGDWQGPRSGFLGEGNTGLKKY
jgi:hypothetical protein